MIIPQYYRYQTRNSAFTSSLSARIRNITDWVRYGIVHSSSVRRVYSQLLTRPLPVLEILRFLPIALPAADGVLCPSQHALESKAASTVKSTSPHEAHVIPHEIWLPSTATSKMESFLITYIIRSSCPLETTRAYTHAGISATCGVPLFGVKNWASHLGVSRTTLEKIMEN